MITERDRAQMRIAMDSKSAVIHAINDDHETRRVIGWLEGAGIAFTRPQHTQLKIGSLSYYPSTGSMNFDGRKRCAERGLAGLKKVLETVLECELTPIRETLGELR